MFVRKYWNFFLKLVKEHWYFLFLIISILSVIFIIIFAMTWYVFMAIDFWFVETFEVVEEDSYSYFDSFLVLLFSVLSASTYYIKTDNARIELSSGFSLGIWSFLSSIFYVGMLIVDLFI